VRVRSTGEQEARVYAGRHAFSVGKQASFTDQEPTPTAVEYLLGALGGDLVSGFRDQAKRKGIEVDSSECVVKGRLDNPLVFLGVVGAEGRPGFSALSATLFVSADADEDILQEAWRDSLAVSPIIDTLKKCVSLSLELRQIG
jgi:uncharacterized OsmC-like protein